MIEGTLIAESIRAGAELGGVRLVTRKISRSAVGDASAGQPELWTLIEFEADEPDAGPLADALAKVLDREHGWYADFRSPDGLPPGRARLLSTPRARTDPRPFPR